MSLNSLLKNADGYALAFQANDITSEKMRKAIAEWFALYYQGESVKGEDSCQQIPYTIVRKLTKTVFAEYEATSKDAYTDGILASIAKKREEAMQVALIGGESMLKPIPEGDSFRFLVVPRNNILVFAKDADGNATDVGMAERVTVGNAYYTLLERRTVDANGYLTIKNRLFRSYNGENLGQEVPLNSIPQYEQLEPEYTFNKPVDCVGLVSLCTPMVNCVDGSSDHVSVYAAAVGLIHNINRNEAQLNGEFDRGESRIIVSADMLAQNKDGSKVLKDHVFVGLDEDQETVGITAFSPALREASYLARKQEYLRNIENIIGLKRGLLSEVEDTERTATEITSSAGEYNLTVIEFQRMWEDTVKEALRVCGILGQLYKVSGAHEIAEDAAVINWGNGVLYDEDKTWADYKEMVAAGLLKPEIAMGWRFNMPTKTEADLKKIRDQLMPVAVEEVE
jgi:A118 family predicted phage portal protein